MAENTIDNLSIQVVASAERAISTFNRLASGASGLRGAVRGAAGGMQDMAQGARDAGTATQEAGTQSGEASRTIGKFWNSLRSVGSRIGGGFVQAVHRGTAAVGTFIKSIARIAFYRAIRSIIKDLGQSFKDLYGYSRLFGTDFAKSMDRITTASVYLRNSLAAMVAPLVNLFAPALDMLADKIVDILNFVNQLFAAINGQETYTVAKKVATTWESTFDSAANHANKRIKEVRNTLLGFDEINRLNGETPTTSGSTGSSPYTPGYSTMFEEKPLEGFFEKISNVTSGWPDWLKWLFGIGTVAIGAWGISKLPGLIGKIFDAFKNLFSITLPDWLRWLFGPKGDNDIGLDIPDKIDLPDADVPVNLKQGDWSVLQQIPSEKYLLLKVGVKMDGWLGNGNPQLPGNQPLVIDDDGSGTWDFTFQQAAMGANNLQAINNQLENMVDNWDDLAWEVAKMASGKVIDRTLRVAVKRSNSWDKTAWDAANMEDGLINRTVNVDIHILKTANDLWKIFKEAWDKEDRTVGFVIKTASSANGHWNVFKKAWDKENRTVGFLIKTASTADGHWSVFKKAWDAVDRIVGFIIKTASTANGHWNTFKKAWVDGNRKVGFIITTASTANGHWGVFKKDWDSGDRSVGFIIKTASTAGGHWKTFKKAWDDGDRTVYVDIELKKKDWTTVTDFVDDSFGGATGGGGKTSGGGAGRSIGIGVKLQENTADKGSKSLWDMWWGIFNKTLEIEQDIIIKAVGGKGIKSVGNDKNALNDFSPSTVTVNSKPGNGFTGKLSGTNTYTLKGIEDTSVKVGAAPSWASTIGGLVPYLQIDNLSTTIKALAKKGWGTKTFKGAVGASDTTTSITANLSGKWGTQSPIDYLKLSGLSTTIKVGLKADDSKIKMRVEQGEATLISATKRTENQEMPTALGGVFSNGRWSRIPQYANGTTNAHGSLFLAGEAGPEIVGHVGGRTEVLNKSQLASAMFSAVQAAMAPAAANFASAAQSMGVADAGVDMETLAEMIRQGVEQAMGRQNELDRQRNEYLRQINEKDYNPEISTSSINKAQQRMNRRAGTTIVPVGT